MLEGKRGYPAQKAMEILVGVGECFDAGKMIPVNSAHLLYSLSSLGKGGFLFVQEMAAQGGRFAIHTDTNPSSFDSCLHREFWISEQTSQKQMALSNVMVRMGAYLSDTCTPYLIGHVPLMHQHMAWNESSAVVFANSVFGARTNREGGPSAFAAAITGRVPEYGYHLARNRFAEMKIVVTTPLKDPYDYGTLGYFAGRVAQDKVPVFNGIPSNISWDALKHLGAAAATSGSVALYHVVGVTPEAPTEEVAFGQKKIKDWQTFEFGEKELRETEASLSKATPNEVDLVLLGCPHASITEFREIAHALSGRRLKPGVQMWISTSRMVRTYAEVMGYTHIIESAGAQILCGTCPVWMFEPLASDLRPRVICTNSAKLTYALGLYRAKGQAIGVHYSSMGRCIEIATGKA